MIELEQDDARVFISVPDEPRRYFTAVKGAKAHIRRQIASGQDYFVNAYYLWLRTPCKAVAK
jgi:hypothetical protein